MSLQKETSMKMFHPVSVIGRGAYAKVLLVRSLVDEQLYAIKTLKKKFILQKHQ